ncbi:MAG: antitoxin Xre-like helix-turn-helix domain-containing protein, partial [Bacteroidota bacterium]
MRNKKVYQVQKFIPTEGVSSMDSAGLVAQLKNIAFDWEDDKRAYKLVSLIRNGITHKTFRTLTKSFPLQEGEWSTILGTTTRTLDRYKKENKTFSPGQTERIVEINQLMNYGTEVFENKENFFSWLNSPNVGMGGVVPR